MQLLSTAPWALPLLGGILIGVASWLLLVSFGKVLGFLNITGIAQGISWTAEAGRWDPSLAFVMGGALMVTVLAFALQPQRAKPWAAERFDLPTRNEIDSPLLIGAALFGAGWGLAGYCPGPALASVFVSWDAVVFAVAMLMGMVVVRRFSSS